MERPVDACAIKEQALQMLSAGDKPELVVLDLDYTVWRCFIDSLGGPPFKYCDRSQMVLDRRNWEIEFFPHVRPLLKAFKEADVKVALASRTEEPEWAEEVIHKFVVDDEDGVIVDFTHAREIYPSSKERHFRALASKLDVAFERMLFYDDERRNIHDVSRLGVVCVHVEDGLNLQALEEGLTRFRARQQQKEQQGGRD